MLHRGPVVITTLEEDFKKIGIMTDAKKPKAEDDDSDADDKGGEEKGKKEMPDFIKKKMAAKEAKEKEEAKKAAAVESDDEDEDDDDEGDDADESVEGEDGDEMDEARIAKRVAKGTRGKLVRTKKTPPSLKAKAKRLYKRLKHKIKMAFKKKMRKPMNRKRAKILRKKSQKRRGEGTETIANLIEDVQGIIGSLDFNSTDAVKSFANIAIISDMLSTTFNEWSGDLNEAALEEGDEEFIANLTGYSESLADLAEAAAEIATALKDGDMVEGGVEALEAIFKEYMSDMLEGMDSYNEMAEAKTLRGAKGDVGESDDDDADDAEGDSDKEEDDDEDEDDAEEAKRPSKR
jgi:hypothetical protein